MAPPEPVHGTGHGWVKSFEVTPDREILLTCHNPADPDRDVIVRALRIELETMLAARPTRRARKNDPAQTPTRST